VPLDHLLITIVVAVVAGECVSVDESTEGVSSLVGAVGVQLASSIIGSDVDVDLVDEAGNLHVGGGFEELDTSEGSRRHHTTSMARLAAPGNGSSLGVADS